MAKKVVAQVTVQIKAGQAAPGPPVGPALGTYGINLPLFIKQYNEQSVREYAVGTVVPARVTVFGDRSFTFELKTPPAAVLIRQKIGLDKGSPQANRQKVGRISEEQLREVAQVKLSDLNTDDIDMAMRVIAGTARQMGVEVPEAYAGDGGE